MVLGIGVNGHIGFNEPGSPFNSRTRPVRLTEATRAANKHSFPAGETVPESAITMGIATILDAREILLVATGSAKAAALAAALHGPQSPQCPASALRRHPMVTVVCDGAAAAASNG
jgi:glucosamine-6-phosphate deaminase